MIRIHSLFGIVDISEGVISSCPWLLKFWLLDLFLERLKPDDFAFTVVFPSSLEIYSNVEYSCPPRNKKLSQLPTILSQSSLYIVLICAKFCKIIVQEISYCLIVASFLVKSGICPILANSSSKNLTG